MKKVKHRIYGNMINTFKVCLTVSLFVLSTALTGCDQIDKDTQIVLTTGFDKDEIFIIDDINCILPEMMVYLTNIQNQYENVYGEGIWNTEIDGVTLEENVKEVALAKMAQVKTIALLAKRRGIELDEKELDLVSQATERYFDSLSQDEIDGMGVSKDTIYGLYEEYALSEKIYEEIIKDINPEISDDEARTITVEHILIKTFSLDEEGNVIQYDSAQRNEARRRVNDIYKKIENGESFEDLAQQYSEDDSLTLSFGKGDMDTAFEVAAFELGSDEISDVVETRYGFHIIKCISTFNREVTDENKIKIVEERKKEVFSEEYEQFVSELVKAINTELWENVTFLRGENIRTSDFFDVYDEIFN